MQRRGESHAQMFLGSATGRAQSKVYLQPVRFISEWLNPDKAFPFTTTLLVE